MMMLPMVRSGSPFSSSPWWSGLDSLSSNPSEMSKVLNLWEARSSYVSEMPEALILLEARSAHKFCSPSFAERKRDL